MDPLGFLQLNRTLQLSPQLQNKMAGITQLLCLALFILHGARLYKLAFRPGILCRGVLCLAAILILFRKEEPCGGSTQSERLGKYRELQFTQTRQGTSGCELQGAHSFLEFGWQTHEHKEATWNKKLLGTGASLLVTKGIATSSILAISNKKLLGRTKTPMKCKPCTSHHPTSQPSSRLYSDGLMHARSSVRLLPIKAS